MLEQIISFILRYKAVFLFYALVIAFLFVKRKKWNWENKIIILYRLKFGLKFMENFSRKHEQLVKLLGYIGVGAGYLGLVVISYFLIKNLYALIFQPGVVSGVSLVLPGIKVPGMGILPFWYWLLAIFLIALVHEFAHGIVAKVHQIPVKNTGLVFLGPIIGAFVEPDEKKLQKQKDIAQYSVLAAGSFANILLAVVALLLLNYAFFPLQQSLVEPVGFSFEEYYGREFPAAQAGLPIDTLITKINGQGVKDFMEFDETLTCLAPGEQINLTTAEKEYSLILAASPDNPKKPFLGIKSIKNEFKLKEEYAAGWGKYGYNILDWISGFLRWLFLLSLGIALFNLLPLPLVDGGRMLQVFLHTSKGQEKGERYYRQISFFFLLVLLLNLIYPLFRGWWGI